MFTIQREWPRVERWAGAIEKLNPQPYLGFDLEFTIRDSRPTIIGLSDGRTTVSVPWGEGEPYFRALLDRRPDIQFVAHNGLGAELPVCNQAGLPLRKEQFQDTIIWHLLTNSSLCKNNKKTEDTESEMRGRGFMNLFAFCSMYLGVPQWKECMGEGCTDDPHRPCPEHNVFGYNAMDTLYALQAFPHVLQRAKLMGVDKLYPLHRDVMVVLDGMRERGLLVDREHVDKLRVDFAGECLRYWNPEHPEQSLLPFNPNSPKQVVEYFKKKGIKLDNAQQETIDDACEEFPEDRDLAGLQDYGKLGNGPDRWFAPRVWDAEKGRWKGYVDEEGLIHAYLNLFTSTLRLACSNPNLQNLSHRPKKFEKGLDPTQTVAGRLRRAVVAPEGCDIWESDLSNGENRNMLHQAGYKIAPEVDLHSWVAEVAEFKPEDPFCLKEGSPRQAAKTVQHGNFYLEGLSLVSREQYRTTRIQSEISKGVRIAYPDWTFNGQIVTFTGINFAERAFGSASYENRKKANDIIGKLFGRFPGVRDLQKRITKQVERDRCVRNNLGYCLALHGRDPEKMKTAAAFTGSNPIAHVSKLAMLRAEEHPHLDCRLQVHDSLLFYVDKGHDPKKVKGWLKEVMEIPVPELDNLVIPSDVKYGSDWASLKKIS